MNSRLMRLAAGVATATLFGLCAQVQAGLLLLDEGDQRSGQGNQHVGEETQRLEANTERAERVAALNTLRQELAGMPAVGSGTAQSGTRRALVVGNEAYADIPKLKKAAGDAASISGALKSLGFEVTTHTDLARDDFDDALDSFYASLQEGDVAVLFYSGHGIAVDGTNYLLPVDMPEVGSDDARRIRREAVDAGEIVSALADRGVQLALVVLDACRDDPFARDDTRGAARLKGLAPLTPDRGVFVLYSAGVGEKALDRLDDADPDPNSIFTRKFTPILETPGLPLVDIAKRTQVEVRELARQVKHSQAPAYYDQVVGQYYFRPPQPRLFGLTIGIDAYEGVSLAGATNDAERIARALEALGAEKVVRMFDHDARPSFIEYVWRDLVGEARPGDTIVLTYAGSSIQIPDANGDDADGKDEVLILSDADLAASKNGDFSSVSPSAMVTDDTLTQWMKLASDKNVNVVFLVDGCHGGGLLDREFANVSFLGASAEDEVVGEYQIDGRIHGLASAFFARGIEGEADYNGDGFVSQRELFHVVSQGVLLRATNKQTPEFLPELDVPEAVTTTHSTRRQLVATDLPLFRLPAELPARLAASGDQPYPERGRD